MRTRIEKFFDIDKGEYSDKWYISVFSKRDRKYHVLMNGDKPHVFESESEAQNYLESVKDEIQWLVDNEPAPVKA